MNVLAALGARIFGAAWEVRRRAYALGWLRQERVGARVVSIGNLSVGGAGKTTLTLALAAEALRRGVRVAVVCRDYRPGPGGRGDESLLYAMAMGERHVFSGTSKRLLARTAALSGAELVLVDDGFSHWPLARDLDVVLLDASDLWGGGALLPAGRLREPRRALQRAGVVIVTRLDADADAAAWVARVRPYAPAAIFAAARHRVSRVRAQVPGAPAPAARGPAHVVTATGNPEAVARTARDAGFAPVTLSSYRDHHWFTEAEAQAELHRAGNSLLLLTAKDAVRWPAAAQGARVAVLDVAWEWVLGGDAVLAAIFAGLRGSEA